MLNGGGQPGVTVADLNFSLTGTPFLLLEQIGICSSSGRFFHLSNRLSLIFFSLLVII